MGLFLTYGCKDVLASVERDLATLFSESRPLSGPPSVWHWMISPNGPDGSFDDDERV
jgi:hypothetical protein